MRAVGSSRHPGPARPTTVGATPTPTPSSLLEVRFDSRPGVHPLAELFQKEKAGAHLIACRLSDRAPRRLIRWLDVEVAPERVDQLLLTLRQRLRTRHLAIAHLGPGRLLLRVDEPAPSICVATYEAGGICVTCPILDAKGREAWRVVLPRGARSRVFLRDLATDFTARPAITRVGPYRSKTTLTHHQDRALKVAYELGYFAYPRRASLGDVARALGAGRSTTLEVLRRATVKLARHRYVDELGVRAAPEVRRLPLRRGQ